MSKNNRHHVLKYLNKVPLISEQSDTYYETYLLPLKRERHGQREEHNVLKDIRKKNLFFRRIFAKKKIRRIIEKKIHFFIFFYWHESY